VAAQRELVRMTLVDERLVVDRDARLPGRGAYLCPEAACWEAAVARRGFARAFRRPVEVPVEPLHLSD
jgi:predicted RNA-binding protein YlxR (DUF448 family)